MAKPSNVLIGKTRGSIGSATFTVWKGINVLKEKAVNAYSNPTDDQKANNSKFRVMQLFAKSITLFIKAGFAKLAIKKTEYNAFQQANPYSSVVDGDAPDFVVNPEMIKLSKGPEPQITTLTVEMSGANGVIVAWDASDNPNIPSPSQMFIAAFSNTTGELIAYDTTKLFSDEQVSLAAPLLGTNILTHTFIGFYVNSTTGNVPDSQIADKI